MHWLSKKAAWVWNVTATITQARLCHFSCNQKLDLSWILFLPSYKVWADPFQTLPEDPVEQGSVQPACLPVYILGSTEERNIVGWPEIFVSFWLLVFFKCLWVVVFPPTPRVRSNQKKLPWRSTLLFAGFIHIFKQRLSSEGALGLYTDMTKQLRRVAQCRSWKCFGVKILYNSDLFYNLGSYS